MTTSTINANPQVFKASGSRPVTDSELDDNIHDPVDSREIFDILRTINDPEHPLTLEELNVIENSHVEVDDKNNYVSIHFTPTIPHCSMATLIGLSIRVKLIRSLPRRFKVDVKITPGSHSSEDAVNKQLNDKERIAAALENSQLLKAVNQCLSEK
ncbi:cytosolic iron-sulfur assembly component 2B-like [Watersipora subatra]|uniref:cytosolic iron-sulfur assembly component 2B-like n=1 Tax=Watersipora subatra TaxID=2589382 RepID=UPI00355B6B48